MNIEYFHASKFGNGARIAAEFQRQMAACGVAVNVHHVKEADPRQLPPADLYVFSSPGRFGGPIGSMRRFLNKAVFGRGARYALVATELQPDPAKRVALDAGDGKCQRVLPVMTEILQLRGLTKVAEARVFVTRMTGPLEDNWEARVAKLSAAVLDRAPVAVPVA